MKRVTIADNLFLPHAKSAKVGGDNVNVGPTDFEWEQTDPREARFVTDSYIKEAKGEGQIAWLLEPFFLHPENYISAMQKPFDAVLTHNDWFVKNQNNWLWYAHGGSWLAFDQWGIREKTKNVSILLSEKRSMPGHRLRHEVVERLAARFGVSILGLDGWVPTADVYGPYRYSIVIESERTAGYFTNRLIDCLAVGTVPIYWGCPDIGRFFGRGTMIEVADLGEIEFRLQELGPCLNKSALRWNVAAATAYRICEDWIYRRYPHLFS